MTRPWVAKAERSGLNEALSYLRPGDTLVVWRLDRLERLGRSLVHLIPTVTGLEERGVGFRSLWESIDTTTSGGKLVFQIFDALAEFERSVIRERTRVGLDAARARGRKGGRPRNPHSRCLPDTPRPISTLVPTPVPCYSYLCCVELPSRSHL